MGDSVVERVAILETKIGNLADALESKHRENRRSIHELRNGQQNMTDGLHRIEIKMAKAIGWAVGAGTVVGGVVALIGHFIDKI